MTCTDMEVRFLQPNRSIQDQNEFVVICRDGVWYVAVVPEGRETTGREVCIGSAKGNTRSAIPGLSEAVVKVFEVIANAPDRDGITKKGI